MPRFRAAIKTFNTKLLQLRASPHSGSARTRARATTISLLKGLPILVCQITGHLFLLDRKDNNFVQKPIAPGVKL